MAHPETDVVTSPVSPHVFPGDATVGAEACPQVDSGEGLVLVFYELADQCIDTLTLAKLPGGDLELTW